MRYKIFYIDDQSFALPQVIRSIPDNVFYDFEFVQSIYDIPKQNYDIVLLDFYLDKDQKTALDIVKEFSSSTIISFSTSREKNNLMLENWAIYAAQKLKWYNNNNKLEKIFQEIFDTN